MHKTLKIWTKRIVIQHSLQHNPKKKKPQKRDRNQRNTKLNSIHNTMKLKEKWSREGKDLEVEEDAAA